MWNISIPRRKGNVLLSFLGQKEMLQVSFIFNPDAHKSVIRRRGKPIDTCSYNGVDFSDHQSAVNDHHATTLGNLDNKVLAVGGWSTDNNEVELFDTSSNVWTTKSPLSFCSSS